MHLHHTTLCGALLNLKIHIKDFKNPGKSHDKIPEIKAFPAERVHLTVNCDQFLLDEGDINVMASLFKFAIHACFSPRIILYYNLMQFQEPSLRVSCTRWLPTRTVTGNQFSLK